MVFVTAPLGVVAVAAVGRQIYRRMHEAHEDAPAGRRRVSQDDPFLHTVPDLDLPTETADRLIAEGALILLTDGVLEQLIMWVPRRNAHSKWTLLFNTAVDGYCLTTLYRMCARRGPILLLLRDTSGAIFGAHIANELREPHTTESHGGAPEFYGTGETMLFEVMRVKLPVRGTRACGLRATPCAHPRPPALPRPVHQPLLDGSPPPDMFISGYHWTKGDDMFVASDQDFLAVGGGGGHYGLRVDSDLQHGRTSKCTTFRSPPLGTMGAPGGDSASDESGGLVRFFGIAAAEVWAVDEWSVSHCPT